MLHDWRHTAAHRDARRRGRKSAVGLALRLKMCVLRGSVRSGVKCVPLPTLVLANVGEPNRCTRIVRVQGLAAELVVRRGSADHRPTLLRRGELATCLTSDQELLRSSRHRIQRVPLDTFVLRLIGVHQGLVQARAVPRARQISDELSDLSDLDKIALAAGPLHLWRASADHWQTILPGGKRTIGLALYREIGFGCGVAGDGETELAAVLSGVREEHVGAGKPAVLNELRGTAILGNAHCRANPVAPSVNQSVAKLFALDGVGHKIKSIHAIHFASRVGTGVTPGTSLLDIGHRRWRIRAALGGQVVTIVHLVDACH
mmetsp:Transcript_21818/g.49701  ORF Transcript_21818/g.49701 Transcript_21818/m.49701 type:complete len:317 (-) Transcript_21818:566-1516(-)